MAKTRGKALDPDTIVPWLASIFKRRGWRGLLAGVGDDDCGVIRIGQTLTVLSADFLNDTPIVEQLGLGNERVLGRIAVAATLADLLGSGAKPSALLVAVTVPHGYPEHLFKELMIGTQIESSRWKVPVIAGDTKLGSKRAVLTCGIGTVDSSRELFLASRARAGDIIIASGNLGTCAAATFLVAQNRGVPLWARRAITIPQLPTRRSRALAKLRIAHGGIDISDGLAADLRRMCAASHVGAVLEVDKIPTDPRVAFIAKRKRIPAWAFALSSGGDFQFIATVPRSACLAVESLGFKRIGVVIAEPSFWIINRNKVRRTLPEVGHKDRRGQMFAREIRNIVSGIQNG